VVSRFRLIITYVGTHFAGYQHQPKRMTVQSELEKALLQILGESVRVNASGRTDAGVHAMVQPCHIELTTDKAIARIQNPDFLLKINAVLNPNIAVRNTKAITDGWHARNSAKRKTYVYVILIHPHPNPLLRNLSWRLPFALDIPAMRKAAKLLVGTHDFSAFCATDSTVTNKTRQLSEIKIGTRSPFPLLTLPDDHLITLQFTGSGFLKQMVRNLVGTLVAVGQGKLPPAGVKAVLASKDRTKAHVNAPPQGLFLQSVKY
jgi:tRNA pseudouridine38-40 synthase